MVLPCRVAWSEQESLCLKRDALIACLEAAKQLHSKQWAQTSVEIAYEVNLAPINPLIPERNITLVVRPLVLQFTLLVDLRDSTAGR